MQLNSSLIEILSPAYRCPEFDGPCAGEMRWQPQAGHVPRGFAGAAGLIEDVELILLVAEPGDPRYGEAHETGNLTGRDGLCAWHDSVDGERGRLETGGGSADDAVGQRGLARQLYRCSRAWEFVTLDFRRHGSHSLARPR